VDPSEPWRVKLLKPLAMATSAWLRPSALKGFAREVAELAFSTSEPPTAGSTRGTMPRSSGVAGRLASEQMVGMAAAKGLKFFSAATRAAAAAMTSGSLPRVATIWSASSSWARLATTRNHGIVCAHLGTSVGTTEQDARAGTGKSGSLTGVAEVAQGRDDALDATLLAEAGLGKSHQGSKDNDLGVHDGGNGLLRYRSWT
jgi:hypothetical protein